MASRKSSRKPPSARRKNHVRVLSWNCRLVGRARNFEETPAYFFLDTFARLRQTEGSLGCCAGDGVRLALGDLVKIRALVLTLVCAASAFGQLQQEAPVERSSGGFNPVTLASEFFDRGNFVNYYAFANAVYDSFSPTLNSSGQSVNNGGFGYDLGGGISAS